ncbi:MAG: radical SAM protein [Methanopyri archaeon]|nr:radical SAM protein [Methanopyri archaeon]
MMARATRTRRLLLVNPPESERSMGRAMFHLASSWPPVWLAHLGGYVSDATECEVEVLDMAVGQTEDLDAALARGPDIVGITAHTSVYPGALAIARRAKDAGARTVLGGPHPSVLPNETAAETCVDDVVVGDGEGALVAIVRGASKGVHAVPVPPDADRVPAYELLSMDRYGQGTITSKHVPSYPVFTMRGCPFACGFCQRPSRHARIELDLVFASIDRMVEDHGMRDFKVMDGTFPFDDERTREFCRRITEHDLTWNCQARSDLLTEDLIALMADAGCTSMGIGVESASVDERKAIGKAVDLDRTKEVMGMCQDHGVAVRACFILGFPDDTEGSVRATIDTARDLGPDFANFSIFTPFPGTPSWDGLVDRGITVSREWDRFNTFELVFDHPHFSEERLQELLREAYRSFYLTSAFARRRLREVVRDPRDAMNLLRGIRAFSRL